MDWHFWLKQIESSQGMATKIHEERQGVKRRIEYYEERIRMRPLVHRAVTTLMSGRNLTEDEAYALLRNSAMHRRVAAR